eukprot:PhM_4_TR2160/c0_g1_i1/m.63398
MTLAKTRAAALLFLAIALSIWFGPRKRSGRGSIRGVDTASSSSSGRAKVRVDATFFRRLSTLVRICIPSWGCTEARNLLLLTLLLVLRTRLTVVMANVVGDLAKLLVQKNAKQFSVRVLDVGLWSLPSAIVNSSIKFVTTQLQLDCRARLQNRIHTMYSDNGVFYKLSQQQQQHQGGQQGAAAIDTPDQRMTEDTRQFCDEVADIYPQVFKPIIDIITFVYQLSAHGGWKPPVALIAYYVVSGYAMKTLMPNFAKLTARMQQLEGDLRWAHSQIIQHVEEIAFYRGESKERESVDAGLRQVVSHSGLIARKKATTDFIESVLVKYGATCAGFAVCAIGVFELKGKVPAAELTRVYVAQSQLLLPLARAIGQLVMLYKRLTTLAGYTSRVGELFEALEALELSCYNSMTSVQFCAPDGPPRIEFCSVDLHTPSSSQALLSDLSLTVNCGEPLLIMGTNGSGKTALLRALAGMWPVHKGVVVRPQSGVVFLSQRAYFTKGTLLQQFIYPDAALRDGVTEDTIMRFVDLVGLANVVAREGGLHNEKLWADVLSGGEKQRTTMVRLFYHSPTFGILDEATCAVSQEIEANLYDTAGQCGVTLLTVSHREALKRFHKRTLVLDGFGGYSVVDNAEYASSSSSSKQ